MSRDALEILRDLRAEFTRIEDLRVWLQRFGFVFGECAQLVYQLVEPENLLAEAVEARIVRRPNAAQHGLDRAEQRRQRCAQLVRHVCGEPLTKRLLRFQRGREAVDRVRERDKLSRVFLKSDALAVVALHDLARGRDDVRDGLATPSRKIGAQQHANAKRNGTRDE